MQFITSKEEDNKPEEDGLDKLKGMLCLKILFLCLKYIFFSTALGDKGAVKCRNCNGEHWTSKCPWKDTVMAGGKVPDDKKGGTGKK